MFWYPIWPGTFDRAFGGLPDPSPSVHDDRGPSPAGCWGSEQPSAIDRSLIELVYGFIAAGATCSRCGAPLGRGVRLVPSPALGHPPLWCVSVVTRCRGRRRHGHIASISRPAGDLVLGPLRPGRR